MADRAGIKTCRYKNCRHESRDIDITKDEYVVKGRQYYHKDCYKSKMQSEQKDEIAKSDLQYIKSLWLENISNTVVFSQLFQTLNDLLSRGISSDYLVFTVQYCIEHKMHLNYPAGLRYFVDKQEIKDAYARKRHAAIKKKSDSYIASVVSTPTEDDSPKFHISNKGNGFQNILKNFK